MITNRKRRLFYTDLPCAAYETKEIKSHEQIGPKSS